MNRPSKAIATFVVILALFFASTVNSHLWLPASIEPSFGNGLLVVGIFIIMHIVLTLGLGWATLVAAIIWQRDTHQRTRVNTITLIVGMVSVSAAAVYSIFFLWA